MLELKVYLSYLSATLLTIITIDMHNCKRSIIETYLITKPKRYEKTTTSQLTINTTIRLLP